MDPVISEASSFRLVRTNDGPLVLRHHLARPQQVESFALPVNSVFLELLALEHKFTLAPGDWIEPGSDFVRAALEEALGAVGHELQSAEALKRRLLSFFEFVADVPRDDQAAA